MNMWLHAACAVLVPAVWGVLMYYAFSAVDRRRRERQKADAPPPIDYSI